MRGQQAWCGAWDFTDATARRLIEPAIAEAGRQQGLADDMDQRQPPEQRGMLAASMSTSYPSHATLPGSQRLLHLLPPPARLARATRAARAAYHDQT